LNKRNGGKKDTRAKGITPQSLKAEEENPTLWKKTPEEWSLTLPHPSPNRSVCKGPIICQSNAEYAAARNSAFIATSITPDIRRHVSPWILHAWEEPKGL
jgi:hypothetical protein